MRDILAYRDDVYHALIKTGANANEAFCIMEYVRKGRSSKVFKEQDFTEYNLSGWFYPCISKIQYMFPKAYDVSYMRMAMQMAWFKVHYPAEYQMAMQA